jgi:signal transduction histidine kinase
MMKLRARVFLYIGIFLALIFVSIQVTMYLIIQPSLRIDNSTLQQGESVANVFLIVQLALTVSFGGVILFLLEGRIIKPLTDLTNYVESISLNTNEPPPKIPSHSTRELTVLSNVVGDTLKRKLEGMNEVSRMVGHDLRNPLGGIKNASYVLKKNYGSKMDEKGNAMLKMIDDCVEYSDKIVRDPLEYSCEIKLDKIKTTPNKLIKAALSTFYIPTNIQVTNDTTDETLVLVDNGKVERVFANIAKNACDAMSGGGNLRITSKRVHNFVEVEFTDSGTGMSKEFCRSYGHLFSLLNQKAWALA